MLISKSLGEGENPLPVPAPLVGIEGAGADRIDIGFHVGLQKQRP